MMNNFLNGMFGKVGNGMCRLSISGGIAVKTSNGYKYCNCSFDDYVWLSDQHTMVREPTGI